VIGSASFGSFVSSPLLTLLHDAAGGHFPDGDFSTSHFPSPTSPADAVFAFFGHHVIASDVENEFVTRWTDVDPFALSDVRFLAALANRLDTSPGIYDAVFATFGEGDSPERFGLAETSVRTHPRVIRAHAYRDPATIRVFVDETSLGTLVIGRGLAGRIEAAYEVDEAGRGIGLGRRLIAAARGLAPEGEPAFMQISPGNVWSMKALAAAGGWTSIGSEVLFHRSSPGGRVD
jgi:GNAT superfamily N-acetyltransferase